MQLLVGAMAVLVALSAAVGIASRAEVDAAADRLQNRWAPAHVASGTLRQGFTDQAAGGLGYLLTGDPQYLRRYEAGRVAAAGAEAELQRRLPDDPKIDRLLVALNGAVDPWRSQAVEPQLAARREGPIPSNMLTVGIATTSTLYDGVRLRLAAIDAHTHSLETDELRLISLEQRRANIATAITVALTALVAGLGVVFLRRRLVRPARQLLHEVDTVADGNYDHRITSSGPREYTAIVEAVDRMRRSILRHADQLTATQQRLTLAEERDRFTADLHDRTVQRVFGLGLALTSAAARYPAVASTLRPLVDETDELLRELRGVILGFRHDPLLADLGTHVDNLAHESSRALGFTPTVVRSGPLDSAPPAISLEMIATLREALSNIAKHADASAAIIEVTADERALRLRVTDNGRGFVAGANAGSYGLSNIQARAGRLGGGATITSTPNAGTTVDWHVPL